MRKPRALLQLPIERKPLSATYRDNMLEGAWSGFRDAHVEPDWLLIYRIEGDPLQFARTGTHLDIFGE